MADKFQDRYRIPSARLQNWDYRRNAAYFITICTAGRVCCFGNVADGKMHLSHLGIIADILWHEIANHSKNVELDAYVVMPNHIHGILILNGDDVCDGRDVACNVSTTTTTKPSDKNEMMSDISPKPGSVSTIVRSYKSAVTKHAHRLGFDFEWQSRFHDHIIRNEGSFQRIRNYIYNNPLNWRENKFYNDNKTCRI
jgi:REP element-mobilizing transposase RayT